MSQTGLPLHLTAKSFKIMLRVRLKQPNRINATLVFGSFFPTLYRIDKWINFFPCQNTHFSGSIPNKLTQNFELQPSMYSRTCSTCLWRPTALTRASGTTPARLPGSTWWRRLSCRGATCRSWPCPATHSGSSRTGGGAGDRSVRISSWPFQLFVMATSEKLFPTLLLHAFRPFKYYSSVLLVLSIMIHN